MVETAASPGPQLWLVRAPSLYLPKGLTVGLASSFQAAEPHQAGPDGRDFFNRSIRQRRAGRLRPGALRFDDYQLRELGRPAGPAPGPAPGRPAAGPGHVEPLTEREQEVLRAVAAGLSNAEIAGRLRLTSGTVKWHLSNIYGKLGARRRTEALARARDLGYLGDP